MILCPAYLITLDPSQMSLPRFLSFLTHPHAIQIPVRWLRDANSYPRGKNTITKSHSVFRGPKIGMQSFCQSKCEWGKAKRGQKHQAAYAHVTEQSLTRGGESHTQTCRGSSLSEEIIRMNTSPLSAPPAFKNNQCDSFISVAQRFGEQRPHRWMMTICIQQFIS